MANKEQSPKVTLVGHPFNPIGTGRALRISLAACRRVGIDVAVRDVWKFQVPEPDQVKSILPFMTDDYSAINIFHLNGNEIEPALERLGPLPPGHNIVIPFWELPRYPDEWANQLEKFDEVWASSKFIQASVGNAVDRPVLYMPLATEVEFNSFLSRRYFRIPEDHYAFLLFFDCRSYMMRKNPQAVVECFRRLLQARPWVRTCLVIKLHGAEAAPAEVLDFLDSLKEMRERIVLLDKTLPEAEVHNLIRCSDAFVSLHRSEGYGLGLAEAMYLGLPVIGTGWSGNMDFMTPDNSFAINCDLVPVPANAYPHWEDQQWAEPDLDEATEKMIKLVDNPAMGRALGVLGGRTIRTSFSFRSSGLRYAARLAEIAGQATIAEPA